MRHRRPCNASTTEITQVKNREEFAASLRELRIQAGAPSFRHLAKITNYSSSTLADATSGRRLPTEPVLKALVSACGDDPAPWLDELRRLSSASTTRSTSPSPPAPTAYPAPDAETSAEVTRDRAKRWRVAGLAAGAIALFGVGLGVGAMLVPASATTRNGPGEARIQQQAGAGVPSFSGTPTPAPKGARVLDGADPAAARCYKDRRLIDMAAVIRGGIQIGALQLWYSPWCGAGWAEIFLYPGEPTMMGEVTVRAGDGRYSAIANPLVKQLDDYTDVIVPGSGGCLGAYGQAYYAGMLVTASIPCESPASSLGHPVP